MAELVCASSCKMLRSKFVCTMQRRYRLWSKNSVGTKGVFPPFWQWRFCITHFKMKYTHAHRHTLSIHSSHFTSSQLSWPCQCVRLWGDVAMWFRLNTLHWLIGVRAAEHVMDRRKHTKRMASVILHLHLPNAAPPLPTHTHTHRECVSWRTNISFLLVSPTFAVSAQLSASLNVRVYSLYSTQSGLKHFSTCLLCLSFPV